MATRNDNEMSGWVGWGVFAGVVMFIAGVFSLVEGFVALFKNTYYVVGAEKLLVLNYTSWGWVHIILGILLIAAGGSVLKGNMFGRVVGVFIALLSAVANLLFLPAYPVWSILIIIIDFLVIYALTVHGHELKMLEE